MQALTTQCCISGGGPAGMMLGYLLARQGVGVVVLEKHGDFLRDFRGDTVHPSTLEVFHELGLLEGLLERPHQKTDRVSVMISGEPFQIADFRKLRTTCRFIAMMPQWDLLDFLASEARRLATFQLLMSTESDALIEQDGQVRGVRAVSPDGPIEIRAELVVAADGRSSRLRDRSGLPLEDHGAPIDVFWMKIARKPSESLESFGHVNADGFLVLINRGHYWQCALPVPKGSADTIRSEGIEAFQERIARMVPALADSAKALATWDDVKLLSVQVNRLRTWWREGFLCLGDAAHAMSPVGGVGINLAVQDAVAAGRLLGHPLKGGTLTTDDLAAVQKRRAWPATMTQRAQIAAHDQILVPAMAGGESPRAPFPVRVISRMPALQGLAARAIGLGLRPEHWRGLP